MLCWGLSFFWGCRHLAYVSSTLYANATLYEVQGGRHPKTGQHPGMIAAASERLRAAMESNSERGNRFAQRQFRLLIAGAVLYVAWHVLAMYIRTVQPAP